MPTERPVFLDLTRIRMPAMALVSILHRLSGLVLALSVPAAAALLHRALSGPEGFAAAAGFVQSWPMRIGLVLLVWSLLHHLIAGVRFLLLDLGIGLKLDRARASAWASLAAGAVATLLVLGFAWGSAGGVGP